MQLKNAKILVMDDEPLVRLIICSQLEQSGALISEAGSCADCLELLQHTSFDAAIFDYRLPDGDGLDLVRRMEKNGMDIPVVMLSGETSDIAEDAAEFKQICGIFPKPANMKQLIECIEQAEVKAVPSDPVCFGRYTYMNFKEWATNLFGDAVYEEWLALDFSSASIADLSGSMMDFIHHSRHATAIVGAELAVREQLKQLGLNVDFVKDIDELSALSRKPSTPSERSSLVGMPSARHHVIGKFNNA